MVSIFLKRLSVKLFIVSLLFFSTSYSSIVSGTGFTKDLALKNAIVNGLERDIVFYISERVFTENKQLLKREFIDNVSRYIQSTKIISSEETFGCFQVKAAIEIDKVTLKSNLIAQGFTVKSVIKPSIIILIDESNENNKMSEHTASFALKEILIENGYTILDIVPKSVNHTDSNFRQGVFDNDFAHFGFENNADLVIRGSANTGKAIPVDIYGKKQLTVSGQMNIEVIRTDNSQIVASNTVSLRKNSTNEYSAVQFVLKSVAKETGKNILAKLNAFCESEDYTERQFALIIDGLSYSRADKLESELVKVSCIKSVALRYLERQKAVYEILINGSLAELRKEMSSGKIPGLSIESLTGGKIFAVYGMDSLQTISQPVHSDVEINSFFVEELYPSKSRYYATHPVGYLSLSSSVPVSDIQLSLSLPDLLREPSQISIKHFDAGKKNINLYIVPTFEKLINILQTRTCQGQLVLQYTMAGTKYSRSLTTPVTIYGINGMNWDHPEAISGFINNDDPVIRTFSRQAVQELPYVSECNLDLVNAIAIQAAVRKYGIQYVKDPLPTSDKLIDMVQYPTQTLFHRTGDCDDLSVLYCSLLASLGIPVAILSYDDHVFFMFSTGIYEKNRLGLSPDTTITIIHDKKVWIPIEATDMQASFVVNWHTTARKFHDAVNAGRKVQIIDIQEAWKHYPPITLFNEKLDINLKPIKKEIKIQLQNMQDVTTKQYEKEIVRLKSLKKKDIGDPAVVKNKIGLLYVRSGDYQKALQLFKQAHDINKSPKILSNYAGALLLSGKENDALKIFNEIYKEDTSGIIAVNRALCKYIASSAIHDFYDCLLEAVSVIPPGTNLSEVFGFDITSQESFRGSNREQTIEASKLSISIVRQNIKAVINAIKQQKISGITTESSSGTRITGTTTETSTGTTTANNMKQEIVSFDGLRSATIEDFISLIDLLCWFDF